MFNLITYFNFGYTVDDLLLINPNEFKALSKSDRVKLRSSLNDSYHYAHGETKEKIGKVLDVLVDIGMGLI